MLPCPVPYNLITKDFAFHGWLIRVGVCALGIFIGAGSSLIYRKWLIVCGYIFIDMNINMHMQKNMQTKKKPPIYTYLAPTLTTSCDFYYMSIVMDHNEIIIEILRQRKDAFG